jgi:hypothetical protein
MTRAVLITVLSIVLPLCALADLTGFGVITTKGWVSYAISSDWKVASMQTKPPTTAAVFQIPNPADEGTGDFTNIAIMTFESDSQQAMASFNNVVGKIQSQSERTKYKEWDLYAQQNKQGQTDYALRYAVRQVPGASVLIRLSWPHLKQNTRDCDSQMEALFRSLLDSVKGGIGPKPKKWGDQFYRSPSTP